MSIDYVKCFDLFPQRVLLALVLELGMDPGICKAMGAMYEQLCRACKVADSLGSWWRATNGIMQGCPLTVILVNSSPRSGSGRSTLSASKPAWRQRHTSPLCMATPPPVPADVDTARSRGAAAAGQPWHRICSLGIIGVLRRHPGGGREGRGALGHDTGHRGVAPGHRAGRPRGQALLLGPRRPGAWAILLPGQALPVADCFRQLGVDVAVGGLWHMGPLLTRQVQTGCGALHPTWAACSNLGNQLCEKTFGGLEGGVGGLAGQPPGS